MRNKLTDELAVCGLNAALAVALHHPQTINRLFLREDRLKLFTGICKQLAERKRPYKLCGDDELERVCKSVHHQGVVAMIEEPVIEGLSMEDLDMWAEKGKTGVVLHSVGNDHNLGAISRAAAFFDVSYIILNEKDKSLNAENETRPAAHLPEQKAEQTSGRVVEREEHSSLQTSSLQTGAFEPPPGQELRLTTSAYRVAEGAMEHLTIRKVANTAAFLKDASKRLITIGTDTRARMRISDLSTILKGKRRPAIALVLGNEETGLPQKVKDNCLYLLRIPGTGNIESLNVSQAAALFFHAIYEL